MACGETFTVSYSTPAKLSPKAWIGIVPSNIPHGSEERNDQHDIEYHYIGENMRGTLSFTAPDKPGSYDLRFNDSDDNGREIGSVTFTIVGSKKDHGLTLDKSVFLPREKIRVTFTAPQGLDPKAWIGIIPSNIPHGSEEQNDRNDIDYKYLSGKTGGTLEFLAPAKSGAYDFRLNDSDNNGKELDSVTFTVRDEGTTLTLNKTSYRPGERMRISFKIPEAFTGNAWIGVIPSNVPHGSETVNDQHDISYVYIEEETDGTKELIAPDRPGSYDIRLNDSDDNGKEVASVSFTVR
jgi:uncharacterized protein YfaS (alpha-2-macroglobulin family)